MGPHGPRSRSLEYQRGHRPPSISSAGSAVSAGLVLPPPMRGTRNPGPRISARVRATLLADMAEALKQFENIGEHMLSPGLAVIVMRSCIARPHRLRHLARGEITLISYDDETLVKAGDIVIQRGTNMPANRARRTVSCAFILVDGQFADGL